MKGAFSSNNLLVGSFWPADKISAPYLPNVGRPRCEFSRGVGRDLDQKLGCPAFTTDSTLLSRFAL